MSQVHSLYQKQDTNLYLSYGCKKLLFSIILYILLTVGHGVPGYFQADRNFFSTARTKNTIRSLLHNGYQDHKPISNVAWPAGASRIRGVDLTAIRLHVFPHRWYRLYLGRLLHKRQASLALFLHVSPHWLCPGTFGRR